MNFFSFGQSKIEKIKLSKEEYNTFPEDHNVLMKVLGYYQEFIFDKKEKKLNETQKAISYYYIVDGMINNSGVHSILLESFGEYNIGYLQSLKLSKNDSDFSNYEELSKIFDKYKKYFLKQAYPPELEEGEKQYSQELHDKLESVEEKWYDNLKNRDHNFIEFITANKDELIQI